MLTIYTIMFFIGNGASQGLLLGALFGACVYVVVGAPFGLGLGLGLGLLLGFLVGLGMSIYVVVIPNDPNAANFRRRLTLRGLCITLTIYGTLLFIVWWLPLLLAVPDFEQHFGWSIWALNLAILCLPPLPMIALASAYTTANYADSSLIPFRGRKNRPTSVLLKAYEGFFIRQFFRRVRRFALWIAIGSGLIFIIHNLIHHADVYRDTKRLIEMIGQGVFVIILFYIYVFLVAFILALLNSWLILCLNRIYFQEYVPHLTPEQYKRRLMWCAGIATFCASPILTFGLFLPLAVGIAVLTARTYAETYYQAGDKLKNEEKLKQAEAV